MMNDRLITINNKMKSAACMRVLVYAHVCVCMSGLVCVRGCMCVRVLVSAECMLVRVRVGVGDDDSVVAFVSELASD
jgi:hypothetical protein